MLLSALLLCIAVIVFVYLYRREVGCRLQVEKSSAGRDLYLRRLLKEKDQPSGKKQPADHNQPAE
jgi:hypothetical protein